MKKVLIVLVIVLVLAGGVFGGYVLYQTTTPQYELARTIADVKAAGIDGLEEHLTDEAWDTVQKAVELAENPLAAGIMSMVTQNNSLSVLESKLSETNWTLEDILTGENRADVVIGFNYEDKIIGTIDMAMIRIDREWKIDGLSMPSFEKFEIQ